MSDSSEAMGDSNDTGWSRRDFVQTAVSSAMLAAVPSILRAAGTGGDKAAVLAQVPKQHAANIKRLQDWIALPSIAWENRNYHEGAEFMMKLAEDAGFTGVKSITTSGRRSVLEGCDA